MKITGFITHYGRELLSVVGAIGTLTDALPIDQEDKARVKETLDTLTAGAAAAVAGASSVEGEIRSVVVKASDVRNAVAAYLESPAGAKALAAAVKGATK